MSEVVKIEVVEKNISVPIDKKALGQFISGLLGQPQTLSKRIEAPFVISHAWLVHVCTLVLQRVSQQNAPEPISFVVGIGYHEGVSRTISSLDAFQHFAETQNVICETLKINISLLIQFPNKEIPEKQEILLYFKAPHNQQSALEVIFGKNLREGEMYIEIRHTERTWADDILSILIKEFEGVMIEEPMIKKNLRKLFLPFSSLVIPFSFMIGSVVVPLMNKPSVTELAKKIDELVVLPGQIEKKVNTLLEAEKFSIIKADYNFGVNYLGYMLALVVLVFVGITLARPLPSFILISKATERYKQKVDAKQRRKLIWAGISLIGSLLIGVAGNFVYDYLKR